jgi:hypothetical protein
MYLKIWPGFHPDGVQYGKNDRESNGLFGLCKETDQSRKGLDHDEGKTTRIVVIGSKVFFPDR